MSSNAAGTSEQAREVTSASTRVSNSLEAMAGGASEMLVAINEISRGAQDSTRIAHSAVEAAQVCTNLVAKLADSSRAINKVVKVISSVAQQTNLLALNATIEAARAGAAGKGFAVVAHEVKELAKETARATEEISGKIETIQLDTKTAIQAIENINAVIDQIDAASGTIAAAVEEQSATTKEIGKHVNEAAREADAISKNIARVADTAQATAQGAADTAAAARTLHEVTFQLDSLVASLKVG
jgi:methyl-accepting chemotaxis protein